MDQAPRGGPSSSPRREGAEPSYFLCYLGCRLCSYGSLYARSLNMLDIAVPRIISVGHPSLLARYPSLLARHSSQLRAMAMLAIGPVIILW